MSEALLLVERRDRVALLRLNRPAAMNALSLELREALRAVLAELEADDGVGAIVITGSERVFAAGADLKLLRDWTQDDAVNNAAALRGAWQQLARSTKPVIAAVAGPALGAGCELAMLCDFIIAADNAQFGQPEIKVGTLPGSGGTQRLTRLLGKSKAMDLVLSGRSMDAQEAERCGLVARVVPLADLLDEAMKAATTISRHSAATLRLAKQAVNQALETSLSEGLRQEQQLFEATFATEDRREGMSAFLEKRRPDFKHR
ncbi:MAG: enoyl-CoA hydratase [Nevskia sp.]